MSSLAPIGSRHLQRLLRLPASSCLVARQQHDAAGGQPEHRSSWFARPRRQPPGYRLVYLGPKNNMVGGIKAFSLGSTCSGLGLQAYVLLAGRGDPSDLVLVGGLTLFALTPLLLHLLTSSYVFWLFASEDGSRFVALTKSLLLRNRRVEFSAEDVTLTDTGIPFANLQANGRKLFIDPAFSLDLAAVEPLFKRRR